MKKIIILLFLLCSLVYSQEEKLFDIHKDTLITDKDTIILKTYLPKTQPMPTILGYKYGDSIPRMVFYLDTNSYEFTCPVCGSHTLYKDGKDEFYIMSYGSGYWEKRYYPPSDLRRVCICGECGILYIKLR